MRYKQDKAAGFLNLLVKAGDIIAKSTAAQINQRYDQCRSVEYCHLLNDDNFAISRLSTDASSHATASEKLAGGISALHPSSISSSKA